MKILKYYIYFHESDIKMPKDTEILSLQNQYDKPVIWALINENEIETELRRFRLIGTGHIITDKIKKYIGTVQMNNTLVWHLFEITE